MKLKCPACIKHFGAAVGTLIVLILSLEAGLRLHERSRPTITSDTATPVGSLPSAQCFLQGKPLWQGTGAHPDSGEPIRIRTNSLGLRGEEIAVPKPAGLYRVLVLGDESTLAPDIAEEATFCRQLEQLLQNAGRRRVEVINAGVSGHCPLLSYLLLKYSLAGLQPDCIILVFDMSDVADDHRCRRYSRFSPAGEPLLCRHPLLGMSEAQQQHSAGRSVLLEWLKRQAVRLSTGGEMPDEWNDINSAVGRYAWTRDRPPDWSVYAEQALQPVMWMKHLADRLSADFVLTVMPLPWQVAPDASNTPSARKPYGIPLNTVSRNEQPFHQLEEFCRRNQIASVSVLPAFRQSPEPGRLFLQRVPRLSAKGHQLFARILAQFLLQTDSFFQPRRWGEPGTTGGRIPAFSASRRQLQERIFHTDRSARRQHSLVPPRSPDRHSLGGSGPGRYD